MYVTSRARRDKYSRICFCGGSFAVRTDRYFPEKTSLFNTAPALVIPITESVFRRMAFAA